MASLRRLVIVQATALCFLPGAWSQRPDPPRRVTNPTTIHLAGGSRVEFHSHDSIPGAPARYSIFLPPSYDSAPGRRYPVVYFLHGMNNDHTSWTVERYGNLPARTEQLMLDGSIPEFLMVHPDGGNNWYTDFLDGSTKAERTIHAELIPAIEKSWRVRTDRDSRTIAGTSMGAYGALKIAMKHPGLFRAVAAGSPIILLGEDPSSQAEGASSRRVQRFIRLFEPMFGFPFDREHWKQNSVEMLARKADLKEVAILFSYGTADRYLDTFPMARGIETLHQILEERDIPHRFEVHEGDGHGWALVARRLSDFLSFLSGSFQSGADPG